MGESTFLSIGQVLDLLKVEFPDLTISKIRFLESQGLLDPERTPSGYRKFYEPDVERLRFILREQQEHYLPLKVIKGRLGTEAAEEVLESDAAPNNGAPAPHLELVDPAPVAVPVAAAAAAPVGDPGEPVSLTIEELAAASGLTTADVAELEKFGLLTGHRLVGATYYDSDCLEIACVAAGFRSFGVEARHLRMYKTAVEREAGFFEQVVTPMLKQRNPQARRQAVETLHELARLGNALRSAMLRQGLRDHTGGG